MKQTNKAALRRRRRRIAIAVLALLAVLAVTLTVLLVHALLALFGPEKPMGDAPASGIPSSVPTTSTTVTTTTTYIDLQGIALQAQSAILYDATADTVLYVHNPTELRAPASITKLAVAETALHLCDADVWMKVGSEIDRMDPSASRAWLSKGHSYKLRDLVAALLLPSGSDAAFCIAVNTARHVLGEQTGEQEAIDWFMAEVNKRVKQIGMQNTFFVTPDGMTHPDHLSTAEDLLVLVRHCMENSLLAQVTGSARWSCYTKSGYGVTFKNTNFLLQRDSEFYYEYATGSKTGFTNAAGYCLAATAQKDGRTVIAIVLGEPTPEQRFIDCRALFDLVFKE